MQEPLEHIGLKDLDLECCDVSADWQRKLADLVIKYEDVFSRHHLDCGEAKGFVHRIQLTDERPFRLPTDVCRLPNTKSSARFLMKWKRKRKSKSPPASSPRLASRPCMEEKWRTAGVHGLPMAQQTNTEGRSSPAAQG